MKKIILSVFAVALLFWLSGCEFSATTAHVDDVKMCTSINNNQCASDNPNFSTNTAEIFISCHLKNAPENTKVQFAWFYNGQKKIAIDAVTMSSGNRTGTLNLQSSLSRPNNGWPRGQYEVVITILDSSKDPVIKKFTVQ